MTGFLIALVIGVSIVWLLRSIFSAKTEKDRPELSYSVFTTEYDIVCHGTEVDRLLEEHALNRAPARHLSEESNPDRIAVAKAARDRTCENLGSREHVDLSDTSILVMLDQSGSMAERMPQVSAQLAGCLEHLEICDARTSLVGFTTVGWHGGRSRQKWSSSGKRKYPGRLCDLLFVRHSDFDEPARKIDLEPMNLHNVLFENVDGEALAWACERLKEERREQKLLIVVSDGAPVDDSTLQANEPSFLWRHFLNTVQEIENDPEIAIAAIGLDYRVDSVYSHAISVDAENEVAAAVLSLMKELRVR
ncbi:cobaltochelatase CobT-related protein [Erythrobacter rubeus]|uniref:Cobalamin biosynthesis protein CobT VWA domain-containing protein n=1 Tax=Erythrobacter rubeus TaxID=2760803 RepID=A0ABR8KRV5_9SPHN|nr:hypothetical protein [Erythrobacter rubeus]MBD2841803.1 hypothetical protein [Erythrobacter rubeus]